MEAHPRDAARTMPALVRVTAYVVSKNRIVQITNPHTLYVKSPLTIHFREPARRDVSDPGAGVAGKACAGVVGKDGTAVMKFALAYCLHQ